MKRFLFLSLFFTFSCLSASAAVTYCSSSAFGYGRSATGGGSATPVLVSSVSQLQSALNKAKNKVIIITQDLTFTSMLSVQDGQNVTLLGLPGVKLTSLQQTSSSSGILYVKRFNNLIIRNLTFVGPGAYDCDGNDLLCFESVTKAWVDHCDFQDGCDGNFDNKKLSDDVTISWCRFRYLKAPKAGGSGGSDDHRFTNLLGSSSSDKPSDGIFNYTWAYCWWDNGCKERMVRCRNCDLHFLNCYWNSSVANYYVGPENAKAYFEGCTFEGKANTKDKIFKSYGGTNACKFVDCSGNLPSNSGTVSAPSYSYTASGCAEAKTAVTNATCGAGATLTVTTAGAISSTCDGSAPLPTVYTVTWDASTNGGTCGTATSSVTSGAAVGSLPEASRDGFNFDGWFTAPSGGTKISSSTTITANETYYAQFTEIVGPPAPEVYTVIWDANGGTCATASTEVESGNAIGTLPEATKSGCTFDGWFTAASGGTQITASTVITGNITYYAHYTSSSGGSGDCFEWVGDPATWTAGKMTIGGKLVIEADPADATKTSINSSSSNQVWDGHQETVIAISGSDSYIQGYFNDAAEIGALTICAANNNGTAGTDKRYLVLFCANSSFTTGVTGQLHAAPSYKDAQNDAKLVHTFTPPAGTKYFRIYRKINSNVGDYSTSSGAGDGQTTRIFRIEACNTTLSPTTYTLSYDENGGSGTMTDDTGTDVTVKACTFTAPTGYSFKEWNTDMNGGGTTKTAGDAITLTEDMTLYAIWQPNTYTVTLDAGSGSGGTPSVTATFDAAMPPITIPTRPSYVFQGYYTEADGAGTQYYDENGSSTNDWTIDGPTTLHAYWEAGSVGPIAGCNLHFWFFASADATTNGKTNDGTVFSAMVSDGSNMSGSITIDGTSYSVTRRTGDNATFGSFTIPSGKTGVFYALAVSSGSGVRQINLVSATQTIELPVAGGSDSYKRLESEQLPAGTYTIERNGSNNVRLGMVAVKICDAEAAWALRGDFNSWAPDGTAMEETAGVASVTLSLAANSRYEFKFKYGSDNYGNTGAIVTNVSDWTFATDKDNCTLYTGPAGDYTFSINTSTHNVSITYPSVSHPCTNYVYFIPGDGWSTARIYNWQDGSSDRMSDWEGSPTITTTTTICEQEYYYCAAYYNRVRFRDDGSNQTQDNIVMELGKRLDERSHPDAFAAFATYTLSFNAGGGTGSMASIGEICPSSNQTIPANGFSRAGYTFAYWTADVTVTIGGSSIAAGDPIAGGVEVQSIGSDIALTAQWTPNTYTIDLDNQSATDAGTTSVSATYNANTNLLLPISCPSKTGNTFDGYYTGVDGDGTQLIDQSGNFLASQAGYTDASRNWIYADNVTLYAKWIADPEGYTVTYNANGGTVSPASRTQAYDGASVTLDTPTRTDYTFLGWYVGANKIGDGGDSYVPTADVTAIAAWKENCSGGGGSTTLFNVDFTDETPEQIKATSSDAAWVAKTYDTYSMSFGSKNADAGVIDIINGTGLQFTGNNMNNYNCLAIPLTLTKDNKVTAVVNLGNATKIKYNWVSGSLPASPNNGSSGTTYGTNSETNTIEYTPTTAGNYVLYLGRSGASSGKIVESIVITQAGGSGTCYYVTYEGNGADGGYTNDPTAYAADDEVTVLANSFTKAGVIFKGWAASTSHRDAETVDYLPSATFTITANTTLFAIWGPPCSTPDAPTSLTNGATTSESQAVSWTDAGNSQWEVYVSTSGSTPATDQTPTAELTTTSYTFTGLSASTSYYWWVRSVCDASHKSAWVAGTSFTTSAPTFTLTNTVSPAGYGTVDIASVDEILSGTATISSANTYTVNGTTVTATPAATTAEYSYAFDSWSGLPATVTEDATVTAVFTRSAREYGVTLHTNDGTINSGDVTGYTFGIGATLPTDVTKAGADFGGWYDNSGLTGSAVTEIATTATGDKEYWAKWTTCPAANSGEVVYRFEVKSSMTSGYVCTSADTDYPMTTSNALSELIGGTLTARVSSTNRLQYSSGAFTFKNGEGGVLRVDLDCPIASGDVIRFINSATSSNYNAYVRHTSSSTSADQITLTEKNPTITSIAIPDEFIGQTTLYIVRGANNNALISYFEIIRACPVLLDANTNGGKVGGENTKTLRGAKGDAIALPHAFKDGYRFKGWFEAPSGGVAVSNPYTIAGSTTLYAQFEDCPDNGLLYKFEVGTGLTNGSVTANGVDFDFNTANYLTSLIGGTLTTGGSAASKVTITGNNAITITDNAAYLKIDLDCALEEGDIFRSTISGNTVYVSKATSRTKTVELDLGTMVSTPIPAALVGEKTLYIWKGSGSSNALTYFEITRPRRTAITLDATGAYNSYTTSVTAVLYNEMPEIRTLPMRVGYVFGGYYDAPNGAGTQYYNGLGEGVRNWDKDVATATLYAHWVAPCDMAPTLKTTVPTITIRDGQDVDMALVRLSCDFDTTGIQYVLQLASEAISGCTYKYENERIYIQGRPALGNTSTLTKTITFTMANTCSPARTYTIDATIRIYPASQRSKIAFIITGTEEESIAEGGSFSAYDTDDADACEGLLTYLNGFYDVTCVNGYATKDEAEIADYYEQYDLLIVTDFLSTPKGYTNAIGTLIDKKPILSFEAYVAGENGKNWHIDSNPKDPSPKVQDMKILCAGHAIFGDAEGVDVLNEADTTVHVLSSLSTEGDAKGLQGFVINEAPDYIFLATIKDTDNKRDLIVCCERQIVFPARLMLYGINFYEMDNLSDAGRVVMHQMIDYLLMTDESKIADCSLVFDNKAGDHLWSNPGNWFPGYNIVPTPYHPTRIIAECHVDNDYAHAGSVKVNQGKDALGNPVDGKLIVKPYGGLTIAGMVAKVNDTRYASPTTIKAEDLLIEADDKRNGSFVYGNKESDVRATVQYYSLGEDATSDKPVWQYIGIPFQAAKTAMSLYYAAWMCRWSSASDGTLGGLWQWVDNNDVLVPFEGYCITQTAKKTYTFTGKLNAPVTTTVELDNRDAEGYAFAANSWTAPIKIQEMQDDDFTNAEKAIYIYHSGTYYNWTTHGTPVDAHSGTAATLPGQYAVVPIHSSPYLTGADSVIPAMQGFFVKAIDLSAEAELKLAYNRVVYDAKYFKTSTQPMRAPQRVAQSGEPEVMVLTVAGDSLGADRIHILSRGDFSQSYEDGWDGRKIEGDAIAPKLSVVKDCGEMAVAAIETPEGQYLSFRAGEDSIYTFSFDYEGETIYLYDRLADEAAEIRTGNTYTFRATNKTAAERFLITATPPRTPTQVETIGAEPHREDPEKIIHEGKLMILYQGAAYDALGTRTSIRKEAQR